MRALHTLEMVGITIVGVSALWLSSHRESPPLVEATLRRANRAAVGFALLGTIPFLLAKPRFSSVGLFEIAFYWLPWTLAVLWLLGDIFVVRIVAVGPRGITVRGWFRRRSVAWGEIVAVGLDDQKPRLLLALVDAKAWLPVSVSPALVVTLCRELRSRLPRRRLDHALWDPAVDVWAPGMAGWQEPVTPATPQTPKE